jgi:tetratricopeptide (TPR) repeat protein
VRSSFHYLCPSLVLTFSFCSDLLRQDPKQPEPLYYRGLCLYLSGNNDQALKHAQEALRNDPDFSKARCVSLLSRPPLEY